MKYTALLLLSIFCFAFAAAQKKYWQQQVNYTINVTLNDTDHSIDGFETIEYYNNSTDTLYYIWIHLWPNAYKNDRTAFTEQMLENGSTDFYFSEDNKRGYINRLAFKVNNSITFTEDHPIHQDIVKLLLPTPLAPMQHCNIETPFHVKLPYNFSRGGHIGQSYQLTQWYPKAAVYDNNGWHEMPYVDQGEFYNDFGNYQVSITLPANYIVAATGELVKDSLHNTTTNIINENKNQSSKKEKQNIFAPQKKDTLVFPASSLTLKTVTYKQDNVTDFAWFADKRFILTKDTVALPSGKVINVAAYYLPIKDETKNYWKNSIKYIKKTVLERSQLIGEYPYNTVTAVQANAGYKGGMEYPTITLISGDYSERGLESVIEHEVGHNWFQAILASNERMHPWMDEGINTYYKSRYPFETTTNTKNTFYTKRMPNNMRDIRLRVLQEQHKSQPIETASEDFSAANYTAVGYYAASEWMKRLENKLGISLFDSCMRVYYKQWKFKHPSPNDFKNIIETVSGMNLDQEFTMLQSKNTSIVSNRRQTKLTPFFNFKDTDKYKYIFVSPSIGYNHYDKLMLGASIHNYTLPAEKFQYFISPLYGIASKQLNGIATVNYHWYPTKTFYKIELGLNAAMFSRNHSLDTLDNKLFERFNKVTPYARLYFKHPVKSSIESYIDVRAFIINEKRFDNLKYKTGSDSVLLYPSSFSSNSRYVTQVTFKVNNSRVLYPYKYMLQLQQGKGFYRINAEGNYFFNYAKGGGMAIRFFASKFGYLGNRDFDAYLYQPKLLAATGEDDFTYNNYFVGRTAFAANYSTPLNNKGIIDRQIMIANTGGIKLRLDALGTNGQSQNWIAAFNFKTSLPNGLLPVKLPVYLFFDIGTYAEAWQKNTSLTKYLYSAGVQLSLFKNVLNIYVPIIYGKDFRDYLKTDTEANKFFKKITFSIDIQNLSLKKLFPTFGLQ